MQAGALDQRVAIQQKSITRDAYGAEVVTWVAVATVWMSAEPISGREYVALRQAQSDVTTRFRMRYRPGITTAMRLLWAGQTFNVTEVLIPGGARREIELLAFAETAPT
jgi:SPP1 family predicted phage head-tail adaptor